MARLFENLTNRNKLLLILFLATAVKSFQLFGIPVLSTSDTLGYFDSAISYLSISKETFGLRMPLYPLFIYYISNVFGNNFAIIIIQQIISIISVVFVYKISKLYLNEFYSFLSAILFLLCPISIFNSFILTESLGLSLSIIFFYYYLNELSKPKFKNILLASILLSIMILLRPQFIFYFICIICLPFFSKKGKVYYLYLIIPFIVLYIWMQILFNVTGHFTATNLMGYNLINHTGKFIEYASPEYDFIKKEYLEKRNVNMKTKGYQYFTIYEIDDSIKTHYHLSSVELSHLLNDMSFKLILYHPIEYLKSLWAAIRFALLLPLFDGSEKSLILFISRLLLPFYQLLIGFGLICALIVFFKNKNRKFTVLAFTILLILISSILFDCSENARYFIYSYPFIFIYVLLGYKSFFDLSVKEKQQLES